MPDSQKKRGTGATPDWSENAEPGGHLWSSVSNATECYVPDEHCVKRGSKQKCSACHIVAHGDCVPLVVSKMKWHCRLTFRDADIRSYREEDVKNEHHWVQHKYEKKGKCNFCSKSLQPKKLFSSKDLQVSTCSWCKTSFHNRDSCFNSEVMKGPCNLGNHASIVVPPSWIIKLPKKDFRSSLKSKTKPSEEKILEGVKPFTIKAKPTPSIKPLIVFINPKSGGNQGVKLLQKFQWHLNPRQVFDLTQGGPNMGLELYKKVAQLRVLACGGDGTVGWVLSVIDKMGFSPPPAVGVLPLGTGNDLARALGWGGGYTDEPISKILNNIGNSDVTYLDRWLLRVEPNTDCNEEKKGKDNLPLNVVNNYFSLGVDAHIALEFHQAREAHPEKFNSRLRNKMFYGQRGGKDLLRQKWKGLADFVKLKCDDKDYTPVLKEHKFHAIVFLNIPSYGGGTHPWPRTSGAEQSTEDGMIEVVGLTTFQLPLLQAGGHGDRICQCKTATVVTTKTIPMQVDGEACKLNPSIIQLEHLNKAPMLIKKKTGKSSSTQSGLQSFSVQVKLLKMMDYEKHYFEKDILKDTGSFVGELTVTPDNDLENVRNKINEVLSSSGTQISPDWCFVDSCTTERFFRIDRSQENIYYITDIANEIVYILEAAQDVTEMETAFPSPSSEKVANSDVVKEVKCDQENNCINNENEETGSKPTVKEMCQKTELPSVPSIVMSNISFSNGFRLVFPDNRSLFGRSSNRVLDAAKKGDLKKLKELHSEGYSLLSKNGNGETALHMAAFHGQRDIIKYLITSAPHQIINLVEDQKGQSALHKAVESKDKNICCMLVAAGASLTTTDHNGNTPKDLSVDQDITLYLQSQEEFFINKKENLKNSTRNMMSK
ncbi:eye-specific diacylglycerol kinase isoform X2 [Halyomorpha halys]|uniref:eye-specific diacylglycerol kinase isoform X2 n=1 Tax=Halyomorpha halys TaxID=286706 RepID=UPI0006D507F6|nr:eye-specific diacylglycerol kinase isoform X2 [Halyomorpha halys]